MNDSQNRSKNLENQGANFAPNGSGKANTCEFSQTKRDEPLENLLKPSPLNALKHSAQSMMISHYTKAFQGCPPQNALKIEQALKEEEQTPITPKNINEEKEVLAQERLKSDQTNFEFDPFVEHSKDELQEAIAQARLNAMKRHEQIEESEGQYKNNARPQDRKHDIFENAKALADSALKDVLDTFTDSQIVSEHKAQGVTSLKGAQAYTPHMSKTVEGKTQKAPFAYIKTSVETVVPKDRFYIDSSINSNAQAKSKGSSATIVGVGNHHSAYDDVFGGDNQHLPSDHHDERLDPSKIATPVDNLAVRNNAQKSSLEKDVNESPVRHDDPNYWAQGGIEAHEESTLPADAFASDGPEDSVLINNKSSFVKCLGVPAAANRKAHQGISLKDDLYIPFKMHEHIDEIHVGISAHERLGVQGLVSHNALDNSMSHYRGGYMPCYFIYDNGEDRYLLDEGSCRLIGITYTGDWVPSSYINNQLSLIDEDQLFSVFFNPSEGDKIFSHVKIKQGPHSGERLYISGSVIQRDDTGIAMLVSGYFTQVKSKFMECLCKFMNHSSSFDVDTFTGEVQFGAAYHLMLGLEDSDRMPQTVKEFEENFIHPEDLMVYRKQNDVIYNPSLGDYYESIYRIKHRGGYYIWCIDRGLVIERKGSGMASRIIGTTTNIDVVRSNFERLKRSIYQDPLTGLHNRFYLNTRYKYFTMEESQPLSLVYVDISGLKVINDYLGHTKGDELVKLAAQILTYDVYLDHEVVRLSGDEFLLIFTNCSDVQCKTFIDKFASTLDERNRNKEFPLPIYFGFGIATLNEIEDGDTFLRCEARADVRLQEYKTAHRTYIYTELQAFIEAALGQKVVFNDNRRLEYLDKDDSNQDQPDVVPSTQLSDAERKERAQLNNNDDHYQNNKGVGIIPSPGATGVVKAYQGSVYGVKYRSVHPNLVKSASKVEHKLAQQLSVEKQDTKISTSPQKNTDFHKKSVLANISRMQYLSGKAEASAEVFMAAGLQKIELDFAHELAEAQKQIDARNAAQDCLDNTVNNPKELIKHSAFEIKAQGSLGSYGSGDVYNVAQSSVPEDLINKNSLTVSWDKANQQNLMNSDNKISAEQERMMILAAEQAALDDMRYAQNSVTIPDDLTAGFGSLEVEASDINKESKILDKAHKLAKEARIQDADVLDNGPDISTHATLEVGEQVSKHEAQSAIYEAQAFLNKLQDANKD